MLQKLIDKVLWTIVKLLPFRASVIETEGSPYLLRFFIKHNGILPGCYLHYFFRGDSDRDLHNHPWKKSLSIILTGGYIEERMWIDSSFNRAARMTEMGYNSCIISKDFRPGSINIIRDNDFHRVDLLGNGCWTIFFSGKKSQDWGFWLREEDRFIHHAEYLADKGETKFRTYR